MELFYDDPWAKLYLGDCAELPTIVDPESVAAVITDPPFQTGEVSRVKIYWPSGNYHITGGGWREWDDKAPEDWIALVARCLRPGGVFITFVGFRGFSDLLKKAEACGLDLIQPFVWVKTNPPPQLRKVGWQSAFELGWVLYKKGARHTFNYREGMEKNVFFGPHEGVSATQGRLHPTQKPLWLMSMLIKFWTSTDDLIVDPFCGSGSTLVEAKAQSRLSVGIDNKREYLVIAKNRLEATRVSLLLGE
jgi:DNA modification methylase